MATITVSSGAELSEAYATLASNGGGTILLEGGDDLYSIALKGTPGATDPVTITSADPSDPVQLTALHLTSVENVSVSNVNVDTSDILHSESGDNFRVSNSHNVEVSDSTFTSRAEEFLTDTESDVDRGDNLGAIRNSSDVTFEGNTVSGYNQGLAISDSEGVDIVDNDISGIQADGIRLVGVQDVNILDNYLHDFYGSTSVANHDDMIQVWSAGANSITSDLTISGNFLNSGSGVATQSIFIGNELDDTDSSHVYQNITISDNVIYNGQNHGITVNGADHVAVTDNTLIYNSSAQIYTTLDDYTDGTGISVAPRISLRDVDDGEVSGNITSDISLGTGDNTEFGNQIVSFTNSSGDNFAGDHFVNAVSGGAVDIFDLQLLEGSAWVGEVGASISQPITQSDEGTNAVLSISTAADNIWQINLDASFSVDEEGYLDDDEYDFIWTFDDGTTVEGLQVTKIVDAGGLQSVTLDVVKDGVIVDSIDRSIVLEEKELLHFDFNNGLVDLSSYESIIKAPDDDNLVKTDTGYGYQIGGNDKLAIDRFNDQIHNLETFGLTVDMQVLNPEEGGTFLDFHNVFEATLSSDGEITFTISTTEGDFEVTSEAGLFQDGESHTLGIGFDGVNGVLELVYDGESVGTTEAYGATAGVSSFGVVVGNTFGESLDAVIDQFDLNADAASAGVEVERVEATPIIRDDVVLEGLVSPEKVVDPAFGDESVVDDVVEPDEVSEDEASDDEVSDDAKFVFVPLDDDDTFEDPLPEDVAVDIPVDEDEGDTPPDEVEDLADPGAAGVEDVFVFSTDPEEYDPAFSDPKGVPKAAEEVEEEPTGIAAFLEPLFNIFASLFGGGSDDDETPENVFASMDSSPDSFDSETVLSDIIPITGILSEDAYLQDADQLEDNGYHEEVDWLL